MGFFLIGVLPRTGIGILGVGAADPGVLANFGAQFDFPRSYGDALLRLVYLNFGNTVDHVPVSTALKVAIIQSLPIFLISTVTLAGCTAATLLRPQLFRAIGIRASLEFLTFIPAFLPAFLVLATATALGSTVVFDNSNLNTLVLGVCVGITPSCLSIVTIRNGYDLELSQHYVQVMRAYGYDDRRVNSGVRRAALLYLIPAWEKLLTLQVAVLIFTEAVFSHPGFGSLLLLAVQRTDVNVILTCIVTVSLMITIVRATARLLYLLFDPRSSDKAES